MSVLNFPEIDDASIADDGARDQRITWLRETAAVSRRQLESGVDILDWISAFQSIRERILRRVWESTIPEAIRRRAVYIRFGSAGRREDLLTSDLDHAVVTATNEDTALLTGHLHRFIARMNEFGCPVCQGFVMSTNPRWIGTSDRWIERMRRYLQFPDWENVRYLFIALDGRPLNDEMDWWTPIHDIVFHGIRTSPFICWEMAHLGIHKSVALDVFGRIRKKAGAGKDVINIKEGLITPIHHSVRLLAVADGFPVNSTWSRLEHIQSRGLMPPELHQRTVAALKFGITVRLQQQIEDVLANRDPSDGIVLGPGTSLLLSRDPLIRHLETAKQLERFTHRQFRKPR